MNQATLQNVVAAAKAKAVNSPAWLRAIERAAAGLQSGDICVTLFCDGYALVTTATGQHRVNGVCDCKAAQHGHTQCVHRCAKRLAEMLDEAELAEAAARRCAAIAKEVGCDEKTVTNAVSGITEDSPFFQKSDKAAADIQASSRENIIIEIKNIWPRVEPTAHLADALLSRFRVNRLEMLPTETLKDIRLALAA